MHRFIVCFCLAVVCAFRAGHPAAAASPPPTVSASVAAELRALLDQAPAHGVAGEPVGSTALRTVYAAFGGHPLWLDPKAEARRNALDAALATASAQGLPADDLHLKALATLAPSTSAHEVAARDVLLTDALLRYATALRQGAAAAAALGPDWHIAADPFDPAPAVIAALQSDRLPEFLSALSPTDPQYAGLRAALESYRAIVRHGGWTPIPARPIQGHDEIKLDGGDPRIAALRQRLAAEGELAGSTDDGTPGRIAAAVRLFQVRHGLDADARVGRQTLAALNVSARARVEQIAANLERWRHLPRQLGPRYVAVNLADASLDLVENGKSVFHTRVIIGDVRHTSPDIRATITGVTFNPPWNVPPSIAVREMLPRLKHNPGYLAANDIIIVGRGDDPSGLHVDWRRVSAHNFPFRLQQRPGLKNSLGVIKLEMPNPWDVYLHDTPVKALFQRAQRGFSHGCIRVQQPAELARRLLDDPAWDAEAMAQAVAAGVTRTVPLAHPVPVYLFYWTAFVDADGAVNFRDDIYGRDGAIERALGLEPVLTNANELQRTTSCTRPTTGLSLQDG